MDILKNIKTALTNIGFDEREIAFYLAAVRNPNQTIYEIAKKAGVAKTSAYRVFEFLKDKKLLDFDPLNKGKISTLSIDKFISDIESDQRKLTKATFTLKDFSDFLKNSRPNQEIGGFQIFRGEAALEKYLELAAFGEWTEFFAIGEFKFFCENINYKNEEEFVKTRMKTGKRGIGVFTSDCIYAKDSVGKNNSELRNAHINTEIKMPKKYINIFPEIDTTAIFTEDELGLKLTLINNKEVSESNMQMFKNFWEMSR